MNLKHIAHISLHKIHTLALLSATFFITTTSFTQAYASPTNPLVINASYFGSAKADIKGTNSDLSTQAFDLRASNSFMTLGISNTTYDFGNVDSDPFDNLTKIYADFRLRNHLYSNAEYEIGIRVGSFFEDSINIADDYNIAPRAVLGWGLNNTTTIFIGATSVLNKAENIFLPILGIEVGRNQDLGFTGSLAYPVTKLQYRFNSSLAVDANFLTIRDTYHLADDDNKDITKDGYVQEESYGVALGATYNFTKHVSLSGGIFSYFDREFKLYNASGDKVDSFESDNSNGIYVRTNFLF